MTNLKEVTEELEKDFADIHDKLSKTLSPEQKILLAEFQQKYRNFCEYRVKYYEEQDKNE
jgi:hypothetical protein